MAIAHQVPAPPWTWLRQVHGGQVVTVGHPGEHAGAEADAAVTAVPGCALLVRTADCAPVVVRGDVAVGVAHAGWRGLMAGVVEAAVEALRCIDPGPLRAAIGPCISAARYEFAADDLDAVAARYGPAVRGRTDWGTPALDLRAGVRAALAGAGVGPVDEPVPWCTAQWAAELFSHRARGDAGRQATFAWLER